MMEQNKLKLMLHKRRMEQIQKDLETFDKETGVNNRYQKLFINPITILSVSNVLTSLIGTCNLFLLRMEEINRMYDEKLPPILEHLFANLEKLINQYEEDKSCH